MTMTASCVLCPFAGAPNPGSIVSSYVLGTQLAIRLAEHLDCVPLCGEHTKMVRILTPTLAAVANEFGTVADEASRIAKEGTFVDYDDFKKRVEATRAARFAEFQETFNEAMKKQGDGRTLDDVLGAGAPKAPPPPPAQMPPWDEERASQLAELFLDIAQETADDDPRDLVLRAMATYRAFVRHARAGGQVKFVGAGPERTLKVHLRKKEESP